MRGQRRWLGPAVAAIAVLAGATPAAAREPLPPPSVCAPPCQPWQTCVGDTCMVPAARPNEPPPPPPAFPPPPLGAPPPPAPRPGYAPYPAYPLGFYDSPPPRPPRQRRFLALPYIGTHSYQNGAAAAYFPGFRIGGLVGGRVTELLSLNWEVTLDVSNVDTPAMATSSSEFALDFAFSPTVHLPIGPAEILLGPKLGVFWVHTDVNNNTTFDSDTRQGTGILGGINAGSFMAVSANASIGVLLSFEVRKIEHTCAVNAGDVALCSLARDTSAKIIGLTAAALFR